MQTAEKRKLEKTISKPSKKKKVERDQYTEVHFKVEIKDPITTFSALEKFISLAGQYLEGEGYDIVSGYCRSSEECTEILQLLDGGKRKPSEVQLIFETLECILLRLVDDLTQYQVVGQNIVRKIWGSFSGCIYTCLSSRNKASHIKTTLKLLTTMSMLSEMSAKAVLSQIDFSNDNIQALYHRRDSKDPQDVRTCLIHLILGFVLTDSDCVIRQLLDTKALSPGLFSGLKFDRIGTVQLVLNTVLEKVIQNPGISKTLKVKVFTEENLKHLGSLYHWKGIHGIQAWKKFGDKSKEENIMEADDDVNPEEKSIAAVTVHKVLIELCSSFKHGIIFFDKSFGTFQKNQNHILTSFMVSLSKALETPLQQDLIVKALVACPDQLQYYLPCLQTSVTPRMSNKWITSMAFLSKIFNCLPDTFNIPRIRDVIMIKELIIILLTTVIPPTQIWHTVIQGLKNKELTVRHVVLDFLRIVLQRLTSLLSCVEQAPSLKSLYSQEELVNLVIELKQQAAKTLPDIQSYMLCWEKLVSHSKEDVTEEKRPEVWLPVSIFSNMIRLEQVISLYQEVFPSCLTDNPVNISKIMEGVKSVMDQNTEGEEIGYLPQLYLVKLLSGADSKKLPWIKESQQGHSLMHLLLSMITKIRMKPQLVKMTQQLVCQLLTSTGLFDSNKEELSLWIRHFTRMTTDVDDKLTEFLSKVFTVFISNPYPYSDRVSDMVMEASSLKGAEISKANPYPYSDRVSDMVTEASSLKGAEINKANITDSNLEASLEMEEDSDIEDDDVLDQIRFPFSPLVVVAFETVTKDSDIAKVITEYLMNVLCDLFHCQLNPLPLICFLQTQDTHIDMSFSLYINSFQPSTKESVTISPMEMTVQSLTDSVTLSLASVYVSGSIYKEQKLLSQLSSLASEDISIVTRQLLLFITHSLENKKDDTIKKTVPYYFKCILEIVETKLQKIEKEDVCETQEEVTSTEENVPLSNMSTTFDDTELKQLYVADKSSRDIVNDVFTGVLKHPIIQKYFLLFIQKSEHKTKQRNLFISTASKVLTSCLCRLVNSLAKISLPNHSQCFEIFVERLENFLQNVSSIKTKALARVINDVQNAVRILVKDISMKRRINLLETIWEIPKNLLMEGDKLSVIGGVGIDLLLQMLDTAGFLTIDEACVQSLFSMHREVQDGKLTQCCDKLLQQQPHLSIYVDTGLVQHFVTSVSGMVIAENLILHNVKAAECFRTDFLEGFYDDSLDKVISLVAAILGRDDDRKLQKTALKKYKPFIYKWTDKNNFIRLVKCLVEQLDKKKLFRSLMALATEDGLNSNGQLDLLYFLCDEENKLALLRLLVYTVTTTLSSKENADQTFTDNLMDRVLELLKEDTVHVQLEYKRLKKFIKCILKNRCRDKRTYELITKLVMSKWPVEFPLTTLYEMVMSLSSFLTIMLDEQHLDIKKHMCDLLLCIVEADSSCCSTQHFGVFLAAYCATLSNSDQKLLELMFLYEKNGCAITEYRPYLWGSKSIEQYSILRTIGPSLLKKASADQILENFSENRLLVSMLNFPLRRKLKNCTVQDSEDCKSLPEVYDPCFILPLFGHLLSPDQLIDCRKFIFKGCLSYIITALSCHDNSMRGAAYFVLDSFLHHLEGSRFPEKDQVLYIIDLLKNSIEKVNQKLPCIITIFLARVVKLMLRAEQHMYQMINSFLYLKPTLDVTNVPEFYKLFNSSTLEYKEERGWMLTLLLDCIRETADYRIYEKRYVFKLLLSYFDTATSDSASQVLVLKILHKACKESTVAMELTKNHGIVTWLINVISTSENKRFDILTDIVNTLWKTMLGNKQEMADGKPRFLPPAFSREMCTACKQLLKLTSNSVSLLAASKFLETVESILQHSQYTCTQLKVQGHSYIAPMMNLADICSIKDIANQTRKVESNESEDNSEGQSGFEGLVSHKDINSLILRVLLLWSPFGQTISDNDKLHQSEETIETCLQISKWMLDIVRYSKDTDFIEPTLKWILNTLPFLAGTILINNYIDVMTEQLIQLYGSVVNRWKDKDVHLGDETKNLINSILVLLLESTSNFSEISVPGMWTKEKPNLVLKKWLTVQKPYEV